MDRQIFCTFFNIAETESLYFIYGQNEYVKLKYLLKLPFVLKLCIKLLQPFTENLYT